MSAFVLMVVVFGIGILAGVLAGPAVRMLVAQIKTDAQVEFNKAKAALETEKNDAIQVWQSENTRLSGVITDLKAELSASEAKVTAFKTLFPAVDVKQASINGTSDIPTLV
jgi:hypothetical protein